MNDLTLPQALQENETVEARSERRVRTAFECSVCGQIECRRGSCSGPDRYWIRRVVAVEAAG